MNNRAIAAARSGSISDMRSIKKPKPINTPTITSTQNSRWMMLIMKPTQAVARGFLNSPIKLNTKPKVENTGTKTAKITPTPNVSKVTAMTLASVIRPTIDSVRPRIPHQFVGFDSCSVSS